AAETRNYAWLILFGAAALALTVEAIVGAAPSIALGLAIGAVLAAGLYIHYFAVFTDIAVLVVLVLWGRRYTAIIAAVTTVVLFAPGAIMLAQQVGATGNLTSASWQSRVDLSGVWVTFTSLLGGTGDYLPGLLLAAVFVALRLLGFCVAAAGEILVVC